MRLVTSLVMSASGEAQRTDRVSSAARQFRSFATAVVLIGAEVAVGHGAEVVW
ncbi:MAG: hypothetical protein INH41_14630 [Myxococcaceae bacterium]|jgi:hypothetical protein|nr:hypothetical protein [Myxococcaceae bacterium]MCA3013614.1 hypothetical protein [Myxococcaceae bacterium]